MNLLFLGHPYNPLIPFLKRFVPVIHTVEPVKPQSIDNMNIGFVVSYGYRHILRKDFLDKLPGKIINCHISYLPYNRGADPNFWSFVEGTPSGVSCHLIDEGIDTGDILFKEQIKLSEELTLRQTYAVLQSEMVRHFMNNWQGIFNGDIKPVPQSEGGSFHKSADKFRYIESIKDEYLDWKISDLIEYIGDIQLSAQSRNMYLDDLAEMKKRGEL